MKRLLLLLFIGLAAISTSGQRYQDPLLYGENKNRIDVYTLLGIPNDTFSIPSSPQDKRRKPHLAAKGNTLYLWDTTAYKWNAFIGGSGSSADSTLFATLYRLDTMRTNLYQRLGLKLDATDTTGKWVNNMMKSNDSVYYRIGGTWYFAYIDSIGTGGGGAAGDTIPYSYNPADWLVSLPHKSQPYFYTSGVAGDPSGSYYESSMYTPTPIHITNGANKGKLFVVTKGDFQRSLFGWISSDKGFKWDTTGVVLSKSATGWDKAGVSMAHMLYDSATNTIHMWYMGYTDSIYPPKFGVGYATASGDSPSVFTKHGEVLSGTSVQSQMGLPSYTGYVKVSSVVKGRETGKYYYHGCYWPGNATTWGDTTMRLWQGVTTNLGDPIDSMQEILAPTGTNTLLENPTVYYGDDGNYWMIYTNGYMDNTPTGGIDSVQYLQTAKTASLKNPNWVKQPGIVFYPTRDSTWMGKRVYNAQLLKNTSDYYDRPISLLHDSSGRDTDNIYETQWMLFYSASYPNSYHDQASIIRLTPQKQGQYTASIGYNGSAPNILQKNGSIQVNIPFVDTTKRWSGGITWEQIRDLYRSVKTGTMGRLAYYDSSLRRVRDLPTFSVTVGTYPTFTFGASGYNSASVYFRNGVGTTGVISEDGGMNYYGSSTYMSHYFRDKVSGGIVLSRLFSSAGNSYAYFTGKTAFGSNGTATSHLQTDKTFAAPFNATAKTANYTLADDYHITADATSGAFSAYLPQANTCPGRIYYVTKIDASGNAVTVDPTTYGTISGAANYPLTTQWDWVAVQSTGSNSLGWRIVGQRSAGGSSLTVDSLTYNSSLNRITLNLTGQADVSVTLPNSYLVNPIHPDSILAQKNDTVMVAKAVTVESQLPDITINTVRTDTMLKHQLVKLNISEPIISFTAGAGFAADTTVFTDSTLYGSFYTGQDSFYVTKAFAVIKGQSGDTLGIQVVYNDTFNVTGTVVGGGTLAVNSRTTGNSFDISTNSGIPPNVWVWLKSPTVVAGKKPEYISVTLIGYRRYVAP